MSQIVKTQPSDVDTGKHDRFWNTFRNCATEIVARNIVVVLQAMGDSWTTPFTWQDYYDNCTHNPARAEELELNRLAKSGYLAIIDGHYNVTDSFIERLRETGYLK